MILKQWREKSKSYTFIDYIKEIPWKFCNEGILFCPTNELIKINQSCLSNQCIWDTPIVPFNEIVYDNNDTCDRLLYLGQGVDLPNRTIVQTQWDRALATRIDVEWDTNCYKIREFGFAPTDKTNNTETEFWYGDYIDYDWDFTMEKHEEWLQEVSKEIEEEPYGINMDEEVDEEETYEVPMMEEVDEEDELECGGEMM